MRWDIPDEIINRITGDDITHPELLKLRRFLHTENNNQYFI